MNEARATSSQLGCRVGPVRSMTATVISMTELTRTCTGSCVCRCCCALTCLALYSCQQRPQVAFSSITADLAVCSPAAESAGAAVQVEAEASTDARPREGFTPRKGAGLPLFGKSENYPAEKKVRWARTCQFQHCKMCELCLCRCWLMFMVQAHQQPIIYIPPACCWLWGIPPSPCQHAHALWHMKLQLHPMLNMSRSLSLPLHELCQSTSTHLQPDRMVG